MEGKHSDIISIDWRKALDQVDGEEQFLMEVLQDLFVETDSSIEELRAAIDNTDFNAVKRVVHRVKGSTANLFCVEMNDIARHFSDAHEEESKSSADSHTWKEVENMRNDLIGAVSRLRREVKSRK